MIWFISRVSFPGFTVGVFLSLDHWSATTYSLKGLYASTHHIWWTFPYPPPGNASGDSGHYILFHGLSVNGPASEAGDIASLTRDLANYIIFICLFSFILVYFNKVIDFIQASIINRTIKTDLLIRDAV